MVIHKKSFIATITTVWLLLISNLVIATPRSTYLEDALGVSTQTAQNHTAAAAVVNPLHQLTNSKNSDQATTTHQVTPGQLPDRQIETPENEEKSSLFDMAGKASQKIQGLVKMAEIINPQNFVAKMVRTVTPNEIKMGLGIVENFLPGLSANCFTKISNLALYPVHAFLDEFVTDQRVQEGGIPMLGLKAFKTFMDFYKNENRTSVGEALVQRYFKNTDNNDKTKQKALKAVRAGSVALDLNNLIASAYDISQEHKLSQGRRDVPYFQVLVPKLEEFTKAYQKFIAQYSNKKDKKALNYAQQAAEALLPLLEKSKVNVPGLPMLNPLFIIDKLINIIKNGSIKKFMENQLAQQMAQFEGLK